MSEPRVVTRGPEGDTAHSLPSLPSQSLTPSRSWGAREVERNERRCRSPYGLRSSLLSSPHDGKVRQVVRILVLEVRLNAHEI